MAIQDLTDRQLAFLRVLIEHQREKGVPPSIRELQARLGLNSPRSVVQYFEVLERAGFIERGSGARNIRILRAPQAPDRAETVPVPLIGHVAAGSPMLAEQNIEEYILVARSLARPPHQYFLLRICGDSMNRAGLNDRDLALIRQQVAATPGERVVALIDDAATVKIFRPGAGAVLLEPCSSNPAHKPIVVDEEFRIQGVVVAAIPFTGVP